MKTVLFAISTIFALTVASSAWAYPYPELYEAASAGDSSLRVGGDGIYGSGSKQDFGIKCSHCHIQSTGQIGVRINLLSGAWEDVGGAEGYKPGATYQVEVEMTREHLFSAENFNGFALTIETSSGQRAGTFQSDGTGCTATSSNSCQPLSSNCRTDGNQSTTTIIGGSCNAIVNQAQYDMTKWRFNWTAPSAGAGELTIYVGVVDGNGSSAQAALSCLDDDVAETAISLAEGS